MANDLLAGFERLLKARMQELHVPVGEAFKALFESDPSPDTHSLHIEVFVDDPGFSFRVFSMDSQNGQTFETAALQKFNNAIDELWPIISFDEQDQYIVWENDPKWGKQWALEQPLHDLKYPEIVVPWFRDIVAKVRGSFAQKITIAVHDITNEQEL